MSLNWEEISAISTFVTMIIIGASAIAALIQHKLKDDLSESANVS
ncbi:MAG TPA: hypothetical protein VN860_07925 [Candidatus Acidoferrales bacterium]|nr:hypothetical protein [Candidatus Acidoferrales bacterium]